MSSSSIDALDIAIIGGAVAVTAAVVMWRLASTAGSSSSSSAAASSSKSSRVVVGLSAANLNVSLTETGKKSFLKLLKSAESPHHLVCFYGSQTGTAEDLATRFANDAQDLGIETLVCDIEDYDMTELLQIPSKENNGGKIWTVAFFLATYGEGEPTDNAADFYDWIMDGKGKGDDEGDDEDENTTELAGKNMSYLIFGLGNKTYEYYNSTARRVDKKLKMWGGQRLGDRGEGDDDGRLEDDFLKWKPKAFETLKTHFNLTEENSKISRDQPHNPLFELVKVDVSDDQLFYGEHSAEKPRRWKDGKEVVPKRVFDIKHPFYSKVSITRPLFKSSYDEFKITNPNSMPPTSNHPSIVSITSTSVKIERQCIHLELDISDTGLKYQTGDHVGVWASNSPIEVEQIASLMGVTRQLEDVVSLEKNLKNGNSRNKKKNFNGPCSLRDALTFYLDLKAVLKQHHFEIIAKYATDEKERTLLFSIVDDRELFVKTVEEGQKTLADILREFPSAAKIPLVVVLCEILPRIAVRYYSISSSSKKDPTKIGITAIVVRYNLESPSITNRYNGNPSVGAINIIKEGLATSWIQRIHDEKETNYSGVNNGGMGKLCVPIHIRTSNFKLPRNPAVPVIMIGPGTGVAPFRGFIGDRFNDALILNKNVATTWLFYGCRDPDTDYLYKEEFENYVTETEKLKHLESNGKIDFRLDLAFSRRPNHPKIYVQQKLQEYGPQIWELLEKKKGFLYVCGDAKNMAKDVNSTIISMAIEFGGMAEERAKTWVKSLKTQARYQEDVW